ncbi:MAG: hypothetical protein N2V73_01940 [Candidatus Methanospirare jalkutatii]|nr:hypothetical protein [Candidatus Methanospirare jalkutatii]
MRQTIALAFIFVGVASLILFTSTDVFTLFARQHTFVNISFAGNDISCVDCHHRIQNELNNSAFHNDLSCEDCHRFTGTGITFASGDEASATPGKEAHAAYTPRCLDCHGGSGTWINGKFAPPAPAFNESNYGSDYSAHKKLVLKAKNSDMSVGENEACLVCHTNYSCEISYSYFYNINYKLENWSFSSFSYNGTRYYDVQWAKSGAKHEFLSLDEIKCTKCHKNIYDALVNGTSNSSNEDYLTHAPIEIDVTGSSNNWDTDNAWGHYRYHYIPSSYRSQWVNNSYCLKCHNVKKYAEEHPSDASTYDLSSVAGDTNSTNVHCAEALTCATCHGQNKTKEVIDDSERGGEGHSVNGSYRDFVDNVASNYARTFNGDICMGCHEAAVHPDGQGQCSRCHGGGGGGGGSKSGGDADVYIESEPSGYAENT